jgi:hypothetical protein
MPSQVQQDIHSKLARLGEDANDSNFQGSRFRARISNTRDYHTIHCIWQHYHKSYNPKDIRFRANISNIRADLLRQHQNKSLYSKDIRFRARISNTRGDLLRQHQNKSLHPKDIRSRANISNT